MATETRSLPFFGWQVVGAAFVLATFGWGIGFYGPPIFLGVIVATRDWPLPVVSAAVTSHFLTGAVVAANLPAFYRRIGTETATKMAALCLSAGAVGWAISAAPWQLFLASLLSGAGWGAMSAAALNGIVSPWFVRRRPAALGMAYNGGSVGGVIFSPLWALAIAALGFAHAAMLIGLLTVATVWFLARRWLARTPRELGAAPDGDHRADRAAPVRTGTPLAGSPVWRDRRFVTLSAGMALGLFAQIGLTAHLFSLLTPAFGNQRAALAMATVTAMAIAGRTFLGWAMPPHADRRLLACIGYAAQFAGSVAFIYAAGTSVPFLLLGIALFGVGFGNATSLPPLVAQQEFAEADVLRAVALMVGIAQASYSIAPAVFGLLREFGPSVIAATSPAAAPAMFATAGLAQALAICVFLSGRRR